MTSFKTILITFLVGISLQTVQLPACQEGQCVMEPEVEWSALPLSIQEVSCSHLSP